MQYETITSRNNPTVLLAASLKDKKNRDRHGLFLVDGEKLFLEAVANGLRPVHILDDLIELDGGEWDGLTFDELRERYPIHFAKSGRRFLNPPGGESNESGLARIRAALDHVDTDTLRCAAIVAHGGVNRLLLCSLLGLPMDEKRKTAQDYASVSLLALENGIWTVQELCIPIPDMR